MYQVKDKKELRKIIEEKIIPLDEIDTSLITDMRNIISNDNNLSLLFGESFSLCGFFKDIKEIRGSISNWDVKKTKDFSGAFSEAQFNGDISNWNIMAAIAVDMFFNNESLENQYKEDRKRYEEFQSSHGSSDNNSYHSSNDNYSSNDNSSMGSSSCD